MLKHALLFPTRGRTEKAVAALENVLSLAKGPLFVYIKLDNDDREADATRSALEKVLAEWGQTGIFLKGPRVMRGCVAGFNICAEAAYRDGCHLLQLLEDGHTFVTQGWDLIVQQTYLKTTRKGLIFFPNSYDDKLVFDVTLDLFYVTSSIQTREWYERFGYFFAPCYNHFFGDWELAYIAHKSKNVIYLPDVVIKHDKFSSQDRLFHEIRNANRMENDYNAYVSRFQDMIDHIIRNYTSALPFEEAEYRRYAAHMGSLQVEYKATALIFPQFQHYEKLALFTEAVRSLLL